MDKTNEVEKFFGDLPSEDKKTADIFNETKPTEEVADVSKQDGEEEPTRKNRAYRRLEEKWQKERESNIALASRIKTLNEFQKFSQDVQKEAKEEMPSEWLALYGDTPESRKAWKVQEKLFIDYVNRAKTEAVEEIENRQTEFEQKQTQFENLIDEKLQDLEDQYNIDLTSDAPAARKSRREFLDVVQKLSPKDSQGTITDYADFNSAFEMYQMTNQDKSNSNSRAKEIANRSMQKSGQGSGNQNTTPKTTPGFRGWMKDYNL